MPWIMQTAVMSQSPTLDLDFSYVSPFLDSDLNHIYSCWHSGNSSPWSLRITTVSGMFPCHLLPCICYRTEDYHCVSVSQSIWLNQVLEHLNIQVALSQCHLHRGTALTQQWPTGLPVLLNHPLPVSVPSRWLTNLQYCQPGRPSGNPCHKQWGSLALTPTCPAAKSPIC